MVSSSRGRGAEPRLSRHLIPSGREPGSRAHLRGRRRGRASSSYGVGYERATSCRSYRGLSPFHQITTSLERLLAFINHGQRVARAHARSADAIAIASYLGTNDTFDRALALFAESYANQNERDYETLTKAVNDGQIQAETGV
jgi:hypothetical protein